MVTGVDSASNVTNILSTLVSSGYSFVGRYYSTSANAWKIMSTSESVAIANAGLKRVVVFQNTSNKDDYFSATQGQGDASEAISLAKARGQASGSAIYFAVDYDASESAINNQITQYFAKVNDSISKAGYSVGVYGSGKTCRIIRSKGLAAYSWLAMSPNWAEYSSYTDWNIKQLQSVNISGVSVDTDNAVSLTSMGAW